MDDQISWRVVLAVKVGQLDNFLELTGRMVEAARGESGVLSYQRFVTSDAKYVHVHERYSDSTAALAHLRNFEKDFASQFAGMVDRTQFLVFGEPSAELKGLLDGFGATYLRPFGDFNYWLQGPLGE